MLYLCYCYLFMHTGVQHDFHIRLFSCGLTVTGVTCGSGTANPSVVHPVFSGDRAARSLVFFVMFCRSLFVLLAFFDLRNIFEILITNELVFFFSLKKTLWRIFFLA